MTSVHLSDIRFVPANAVMQAKGTVGWVVCSCGGLQLDCIRVRRLEDGRYSLAFPKRMDSSGVMHPIVRPLDRQTRDSFESQIMSELWRRGLLPTPHSNTPATSAREERRP